MKISQRFSGSLAGLGLSVLIVFLAVLWNLQQPTVPALAAQLEAQQPVSGWTVCRDLGIGSVPGAPDWRQRLRLCHPEGWKVNAYCTQPELPAPPLGKACTRTGEDTFKCGAKYQLLRVYRLQQTPEATPTPSPTFTVEFTPTASLTPTASVMPVITRTPTIVVTKAQPPRPPTGGEGNAAQVHTLIFVETGIFLLATGVGLWYFRRRVKCG